MSNSLQPHGLYPTRLFCPWDSPGKNNGVCCHALLQGFFLTQGSSLCLLCLLHCRQVLYPLSHLGSPYLLVKSWKLLQSETRQGCPLLPHFSQHNIGIFGQDNQAKKKKEKQGRKGSQIRKREVKLFLFVDDIILYMENAKDSTKKTC